MDSVVSLEIDGYELGGWETVEIERSIDQLAGAFRLTVSENEPDQPLARRLVLGAPCSILLDDEPVVTGYLEDREISYSAATHSVAVGGRDGVGDLIDCSADRSPGGWKGQTVDRIVSDLVSPFAGITFVSVSTPGPPFAEFQIQPGESVAETISRATRMRALVPVSDGVGGLRLIVPGESLAPTEIVRSTDAAGRVLGGRIQESTRGRFSTYRVKGQSGDSAAWLSAWGAAQEGTATDPGVPRHRPLVIVETSTSDDGALRRRAQFEATTRAARSAPVTYRVQGWRADGGWMWAPGYRLPVFDPELGVGTESGAPVELLVASVRFTIDDQVGQVSEITLLDPSAFQARELAEKPASSFLWEADE